MAEDNDKDPSQQTEEPTAHRLEKAREEGQIPYSRDINHWVVICVATFMVTVILPYSARNLSRFLSLFLRADHWTLEDKNAGVLVLSQVIFEINKTLALPFLALVVACLGVGFAQTRFLFSTKNLQPKLNRLSPLKGAGRLFSKRSVVEFLKNIAKFLIVGMGAFFVIWPEMRHIGVFPLYSLGTFLDQTRWVILRMMIAIVSIMGVLALLDFFYQRFSYLKQMRMSRQEVKEEQKQLEGSPEIRQRLQRLRQERARMRISQRVPESSFVVTNPTHYALALKYEHGMTAPVVLAKGSDFMAQQIRLLAKENNIPVIENPPLARALYGAVEIDQEIPPQFYAAVARIIRYIMGLDRRYIPETEGL